MQGRRDIGILPPKEQDLEAIRHNRAQLKTYGAIDTVCASSLERTRQTADLYGVPDPVVEPLLDEIDFGPYEGQSRDRFLEDCGDEWIDNPGSLVFGETMADFQLRIESFLAKYDGGGRVLVFGHGGWIRGLLSITRYGDLRAMNRIWVENNHLVYLDVDVQKISAGPTA